MWEESERAHAAALQRLSAAVGPKAETRCASHNRFELRNAITSYVANRATAEELAGREKLLHRLDRVWTTPDDADLLNQAGELVREG
jgi:hypothetical protein